MRMELLKYLEAEADKLHEENFSSSDEFRTVNNSFVEGFNYALAIVQGHEIKLNENQQVVLDYLIKQAERCSDIGYLVGDLNFFASTEDGKAWAGLTEKERYRVLAAFAEWGCKSNE